MEILFFLFLFGVPIGLYLFSSSQRRAAENAALERRAAWAEYKRAKRAMLDHCFRSRNDFRVSRRFDSADLLYAMAIDDEGGRIWLVDATDRTQFDGRILPCSAIISAKVVEESKSVRETHTDRSSQAAGILVGELLGGSTGALIGGLTARKVSTSTRFSLRIELHVTVDSPERPLWKFVFSEEALEKGSSDHQYLHEQAKQWEASLKVSARRSVQGKKTRKSIETRPSAPVPALPAEPVFYVARSGTELGELPVSRIWNMIDGGDLSLDEDFFYDPQAAQWTPLMSLPA